MARVPTNIQVQSLSEIQSLTLSSVRTNSYQADMAAGLHPMGNMWWGSSLMTGAPAGMFTHRARTTERFGTAAFTTLELKSSCIESEPTPALLGASGLLPTLLFGGFL